MPNIFIIIIPRFGISHDFPSERKVLRNLLLSHIHAHKLLCHYVRTSFSIDISTFSRALLFLKL
jgi:hypothetical protein